MCSAAFSVQNKHLRGHKQLIVQLQKQESSTAVSIYSQQLGKEEEISVTVEKSARGSIIEGIMLKNFFFKKKEWYN